MTRGQSYAEAARSTGVPTALLKAVSYLESRWDDHGGRPSTAGGYGPMHLTAAGRTVSDGQGVGDTRTAASQQTLARAAQLTGLSPQTLRTDPGANICGGAAVLASYHAGSGGDLSGWAAAVNRYGVSATAGGDGDTSAFAEQVYRLLRTGASRRTENGDRVTLAPHRDARLPSAAVSDPRTDCPKRLDCEWIPAPYQKLDPDAPDSTGDYGNHDLADRTGAGGPKIRYIVIHDTEGSYNGTINLVQDPAYVSWNYTVRASDGHIAQHVDNKDVAYHAGNWYMNIHSIGIEHEGFGGTGDWYTESMYENSAALVRRLTKEYDIPRDRSHIIGHDQIPGILPGYTKSMHWDPGPYWNWQRYMKLLDAPIGGGHDATTRVAAGDVVTVRPGYADNRNDVTRCQEDSPGSPPCDPKAGTNFVYLRQAPRESAPLATDIGWHPDGAASTTSASDVGSRAAAGTQLVVADRRRQWVEVSWAGQQVWLKNPAQAPVLVPSAGSVVTVKDGLTSARTYGRAFPEPEAYPESVTPQAVTPLEYTLLPGQAYVVGDRRPITDYYRAVSFDGSAPSDRTDIIGQTRYLWVWTGHRQTFVPLSDVDVSRR